jgi:hypothetical protein
MNASGGLVRDNSWSSRRRRVIAVVRVVCPPTPGATAVLATVEPCSGPDPVAVPKAPRHRPACPHRSEFRLDSIYVVM